MRACQRWAEVQAVGGQDPGYARSGRLQPIADERALTLAHQRAENAKTLWQGKAHWAVKPATDFEGWCPQSPTGLVIHDSLSARVHPRQACQALAAALSVKGCDILSSGTASGKVVWATGWQGLMDLSAALDRPIGNGVKGQAVLLKLDRPTAPQLFADALHVIPHGNGTVAIGSTSERNFDDPETTDSQLDDIYARAVSAVPELATACVIQRWAGVRPRAKSRAPMLGYHPIDKSAFIANGGFKIGFGMAPKVGAVMADLILEGHDTIPDAFKPEASL